MQSVTMQEMTPLATTELDISEHIRSSQEAVRGKSLQEAIDVLCRYMAPVAESEIEQRVRNSMSHFLFIHLFGKEFVDAEGKVIARRPGIFGSHSEPEEEVIRAEMENSVTLDYDVRFNTWLRPMLEVMYAEHAISLRDLDYIVRDNEFIPSDRRIIFARGFLSGFHCDWLMAAHLLVPQVENSIRYVLRSRGIITSKLDSRFLQEEHTLNSLLDRTETKEIFGADMAFNFRALLISKYGSNFRHSLAHGLVGESECYSIQVVQIWWLILRLCHTIYLLGRKATRSSSETEQSPVS